MFLPSPFPTTPSSGVLPESITSVRIISTDSHTLILLLLYSVLYSKYTSMGTVGLSRRVTSGDSRA